MLGQTGSRGSVTIGGMATLTPEQQRRKDRVEGLIRVMAPALDIVLSVGDRVSKIVEPEDYEHYPVRASGGTARSPIGGDPRRPSAPPRYSE